ncbi:5-formyltetrahydrofolate cyclo-ligase [Sphingomonas hankookensis]|uniref:5-formyltetrahydrofolate cyclo-ligase n=1 Tax=Sphingomonas hankookensis TaxID=563996 RepID=UPI001F59B66E|nr:5-formyltetrahydrofolate cyclo-ligase [Sphingomonas hankookensis]
MIDKTSLRRALRARRRGFAATCPPLPAPSPLLIEALRPGVIVASYVPVGGEADPALFDAAVLAAGGQLAWPVVVDLALPITFHVAPPEAMIEGPYGLRQPVAADGGVVPDIILTPLVGFDSRCNRLGQGAGHYDRAFALWPDALRIGIAWSVQQVDDLPRDPWDVPLHMIVTEADTFLPGGPK